MKSVISHFYNEEYLLPWWLNHHKKYFDYGLMINYKSTDNSVKIIKEICPDWQIVDSVNPEFSAKDCDEEVMYYEDQIDGWKIALNVTEFLYGDYKSLDEIEKQKYFYIPSFYFVDDKDDSNPDLNIPLHDQIFNGIDYKDKPHLRRLRCLHNSKMNYPLGRHFENYEDTTEDFVIFSYGFAPMNESVIKRKLQIQHRIPQIDKRRGFGTEHHNFGQGLTRESLFDMMNEHRSVSQNLTKKMKKYLRFI